MAETFKEYLAEQLRDPEFAAAYAEVGKQVDSEFAAIRAARSTLAIKVLETVREFDRWAYCQCSECKLDARSHGVDTYASLAKLTTALRDLFTREGIELNNGIREQTR